MSSAINIRGILAGSVLLLLGGSRLLAPAPAAAGAAGHPVAARNGPPTADDLRRLGECLAGNYSSAAQAAADTSYQNIRLHVVAIWPEQRQQQYW